MSRFGHTAPGSQSSCLPYCKALLSVQKATACFLGAWLVQGGVGQAPTEALNVHSAGSGFWVPSGKTFCLYDYFCDNGLGCSPVANRGIYNRNTHFLLGPENIHIIHLLTSRALLIHHLYIKVLANTTLAVLRLFSPMFPNCRINTCCNFFHTTMEIHISLWG